MEERKDGNVSKGNVHDIKKSYKMRKGEKERRKDERIDLGLYPNKAVVSSHSSFALHFHIRGLFDVNGGAHRRPPTPPPPSSPCL